MTEKLKEKNWLSPSFPLTDLEGANIGNQAMFPSRKTKLNLTISFP